MLYKMTPKERFKVIRNISREWTIKSAIEYALANTETHGWEYVYEFTIPFATSWYNLTEEESAILWKYVRQEYNEEK